MSLSLAPQVPPPSNPVLVVRRVCQPGACYTFSCPERFAKFARLRSNQTRTLRLTLGYATRDFAPAAVPRGGVHEEAIAWANERFAAALGGAA